MIGDVKKISRDISSSRLFAPEGKREITESGDTKPTAADAPTEAPTQTGPSKSAQATSTKGQKKAKQAKTCRISQHQLADNSKIAADDDQQPNGSTPNELEDSASGENNTAIPQEVSSRAAHQARVYALIGQCWPVAITDKDLKRTFNQASNRIACQISAEYAAKDREIERLRRAGLRQTNTADASRARPADHPLTREELIGIITEALRDDQVKGTEVSSLTKTIRELVPELFTDQSAGILDPAAYLEHITRFAGLSGSEIVQQVGGVDWMQQRLSEMLKVDIIISPRP